MARPKRNFGACLEGVFETPGASGSAEEATAVVRDDAVEQDSGAVAAMSEGTPPPVRSPRRHRKTVPTKRTTIVFPESLYEDIWEQVDENGSSFNSVVVAFCQERIDKIKKKQALKKK